jgi:hypothetical protein
MARQAYIGATAAATLPAALAAAVLVSAPFAGTKTAPIADKQPVASSAATAHRSDPLSRSDSVRSSLMALAGQCRSYFSIAW